MIQNRGVIKEKQLTYEEQSMLLAEAYMRCDKKMLIHAIALGIDLNLKDKDGVPYWEYLRNAFASYLNIEIAEAVQIAEESIKKKHIYEFLDITISHGLDLNIVYYDAHDCAYYAPIFWFIYNCYSPQFLSYLIREGMDVNLIVGKSTILDRIDAEGWFDQCDGNEAGGYWTAWAVKYLRFHGARYYVELTGQEADIYNLN